ncbi:hypothetical protein V2I01_21345 [Micromonospora sp. BRA006-A]|nr:hypothetical protein [Micromonospora sp. BRA006-A]
MAGRTADVIELGGWNERFFLYYEDHELGLRAWRHGMPVAVLGDVRWTHHGLARRTRCAGPGATLELRSARTFFGLYPEFLVGLPRPARRHRRAAGLVGTAVPSVPSTRTCRPLQTCLPLRTAPGSDRSRSRGR